MALYSNVLRNFQPFGDAATDAVMVAGGAYMGSGDSQYMTDWPGVVGQANQLWAGAQSLVNSAQPEIPMAPSTAPPLLQAPTAPAAGTSPLLLIGGAALLYYVFMR